MKIVQKIQKVSKKKSAYKWCSWCWTINYNTDTNISDVLSNKSTQIAATKIVKKYGNLARKKPYLILSKKTDDDVFFFLKQVPVHPRDRVARKTKDDVKFVKQVPVHSRERLKRKRKSTRKL